MKIKNIAPVLFTFSLLTILFTSCEEDFSELESSVFSQGDAIEPDDTKSVVAYSRKLLPVQTNELPVYQIGVYNDPVYGKTTANFLTQLSLGTPNPDFLNEPVIVPDPDNANETIELPRDFRIEHVILNIPFFVESEEVDGETRYTLDSVYGNSPMNIRIRESGFFLRDLDPSTGFEEAQEYFSDQGDEFNSNAVNGFGNELNILIEDFVPSNEEIELVTSRDSTLTFAPGLVVEIPREFIQERIIDREDDEVLINNNNFKNYMRGLLIEVEETSGGDNMFYFNTQGASISINYSYNSIISGAIAEDDDGNVIRDSDLLELNFADISINTFENNFPQEIMTALSNPNTEEGEETLYLKGGEGAITVLELFGNTDEMEILDGVLVEGSNGVPDELDQLRVDQPIINDAQLVFYVDQDKVTGGTSEPERIMIFDITNGNILVDYQFDITAANPDPVEALTQHLGRLERGSDENGDFYKLRITNHLSNVINRDSTNVPLGLMVSQNVLVTSFQSVETVQSPGIEDIPTASVIAREGTVLHGNLSPDEEKRLRLDLFFTKPE